MTESVNIRSNRLKRSESDRGMRILVAGEFPPYGNASATRALHLAACMETMGCDVKVVSIWGAEMPAEVTEGFPEIPVLRIVIKNETTNKICRFISIFKKVYAEIRDYNASIIIIYGGPSGCTLPIFLSAKCNRLMVLTEVCEWFPFDLMRDNVSVSKYMVSDFIYRNTLPILSNGVICISTFIQKRIRRYNKNTIVVPALSPLNIGSPHIRQNSGTFLVVYTGKFKKEDAAHLLIHAVRICKRSGSRIVLEMIGSGNEEEYCKSIVRSDPELHNIVKFTPQIIGSQYFDRIRSASCLVIVRPRNRTNEANFPTRLPEYLQTGNPVIVSSVGDIERYVCRGVHAHVIDIISPESLAESLLKISSDVEYASNLGMNGKELSAFSTRRHGKRLLSFVKKLRRKRQ